MLKAHGKIVLHGDVISDGIQPVGSSSEKLFEKCDLIQTLLVAVPKDIVQRPRSRKSKTDFTFWEVGTSDPPVGSGDEIFPGVICDVGTVAPVRSSGIGEAPVVIFPAAAVVAGAACSDAVLVIGAYVTESGAGALLPGSVIAHVISGICDLAWSDTLGSKVGIFGIRVHIDCPAVIPSANFKVAPHVAFSIKVAFAGAFTTVDVIARMFRTVVPVSTFLHAPTVCVSGTFAGGDAVLTLTGTVLSNDDLVGTTKCLSAVFPVSPAVYVAAEHARVGMMLLTLAGATATVVI